MTKRKKVVFCGIILVISIVTPVYINDWFPMPHLQDLCRALFPPAKRPPDPDPLEAAGYKPGSPFTIVSYRAGTPLFSNRGYYDRIGDNRLEGLQVLQIPRHLESSIDLELAGPVKIFRVLTASNDNSIFSDWTTTDIKVKIRGASCTHTTVVSMDFEAGIITLKPGGPMATSPILIDAQSTQILVLKSKGKSAK
ncbi:MAG: hypothetical protein HRT89_05025 [Lentisphaeria bacterium]|nr:hypothetical protein [Lentisphaeria bacterium]NQZ67412.1 hypothetical protein [Lentisphaeria bacterium]